MIEVSTSPVVLCMALCYRIHTFIGMLEIVNRIWPAVGLFGCRVVEKRLSIDAAYRPIYAKTSRLMLTLEQDVAA